MSKIVITPNLEHHDDIYARLIDLHAGKSQEESALLNARLILLLINHVGDLEAVLDAIELAGQRQAGRSAGDQSGGTGL